MDFLSAVHRFSSLDGEGGPGRVTAIDGATPLVALRVHVGNGWNNAGWTGEDIEIGDGDGTTRGPYSALDVVSHEIMHGVTQFASELEYIDEAGALNESWSDVFGAMVTRRVRGASNPGVWTSSL